MGILSFIGQLNAAQQAKDQAELERQSRLKEIEAHRQAAISEDAAHLEGLRKQHDITTVADQHMLRQAIEKTLASQHTGGLTGLPEFTPEELTKAADTEFAKTIASQPMAQTAQNMTTSAMERNKQSQLEGAAPYAYQTGHVGAADTIQAARTNTAENLTRENVALAGTTSKPRVAQQQDENLINELKLKNLQTSSLLPTAGLAGKKQAANQLGEFDLTAQNTANALKQAQSVNPALLGQAANSQAQEVIDSNKPENKLLEHFSKIPEMSLAAQTLRKLPAEQQAAELDMLSSALGLNRISSPIPTTSSQLPNRAVPAGSLGNINDPRFKKQY